MKLWIASDLHLVVRKDFGPGRRRPDDFDVLVLAGNVSARLCSDAKTISSPRSRPRPNGGSKS